MSFLTLSKGISDFNKAVISLWFRIPSSSVGTAGGSSSAVLAGVIPLLTFGMPQTVIESDPIIEDVGTVVGFTWPEGFPVQNEIVGFTQTGEHPADPSYIGIHYDSTRKKYTMRFNFQTADFATVTNLYVRLGSVVVYGGDALDDVYPFDDTVGSGWSGGSTRVNFATMGADLSMDRGNNPAPESFYVETIHELEPDQWHHLLLSVDFSNDIRTHSEPQHGDGERHEPKNTAAGTSSSVRLWYAIDDVNYNGATDPKNLGPYFVDGGNPNAILTAKSWEVANGPSDVDFNLLWPSASYEYSGIKIPSNEAELGIPASIHYANDVYHIEMAEFQMWTGIALDTGKVENRRAFIDKDGKPEKPAKAEKFLGRKPEVMLHKSNNWIKGNNTGSLGIGSDGEKIPEGQFIPTAKIRRYSPGPSLHGPQSPTPTG